MPKKKTASQEESNGSLGCLFEPCFGYQNHFFLSVRKLLFSFLVQNGTRYEAEDLSSQNKLQMALPNPHSISLNDRKSSLDISVNQPCFVRRNWRISQHSHNPHCIRGFLRICSI